jgi:hypothetical protein
MYLTLSVLTFLTLGLTIDVSTCQGLTMATWKVLDLGKVPEGARTIPFACSHCGTEADLPIVGTVIAQLEDGAFVFDCGPQEMPLTIQCRKCRHVFESGKGSS